LQLTVVIVQEEVSAFLSIL